MSPIIHMMTARPVELPFMSSFKHTNVIDRDFLVFDASGNMIIDSDGLPMTHGLKDMTARYKKVETRKRHITREEGRKDSVMEAILTMLRTGESFTCTEISDGTGFCRVTVLKRMKELIDKDVCRTKMKVLWRKPVTCFYIPKI